MTILADISIVAAILAIDASSARADVALSIVHDVAELSRRGDTIVTREDLRTVLRNVDPFATDATIAAGLDRLERELGGA